MKLRSLVSVRVAVLVSLTVAVSAAVLLTVIWGSSRELRSAARRIRAEHEFSFSVRSLPAPLSPRFEVVSSPAIFLQAARFQDHLFIAGPAGLREYSADGSMLHQYAVGSDLPGSPLVAVAPAVLADSRETELIVATASDGLLAFN